MKIEFLGAARTVTGSMHLITTTAGSRILLDCGLYQGPRAQAREINRKLPFDPATLDAVVLSHAHIDHAGNLPSLVTGESGGKFRGMIYSTHATREICAIMLPDSARIQEGDAKFLRKHGQNAVEPIYTEDDALEILESFVTFSYHTSIPVANDVRCTFYDAGHILGSAVVALDIEEESGPIRLVFTGDLGRPNRPVLRDPEFPGDADCIISESTYGDRLHESYPDLKEELRQTIARTTSRGGKVIIPAFAVERTQDIVYLLNLLFNDGELPRVPIYVDSPTAMRATEVYRSHPECFNKDVAKLLQTDPDPFGFETLHYIRSVDESKALNFSNQPCVVISASGMMEGGRILHHLAHTIEDEANTILVMGYQAENTLGRRIVERREHVNILGNRYALRAEVKVINGLSGHADSDELLSYLARFDRDRARRIFLVHGELNVAESLRDRLLSSGFPDVTIPEKFSSYEL